MSSGNLTVASITAHCAFCHPEPSLSKFTSRLFPHISLLILKVGSLIHGKPQSPESRPHHGSLLRRHRQQVRRGKLVACLPLYVVDCTDVIEIFFVVPSKCDRSSIFVSTTTSNLIFSELQRGPLRPRANERCTGWTIDLLPGLFLLYLTYVHSDVPSRLV